MLYFCVPYNWLLTCHIGIKKNVSDITRLVNIAQDVGSVLTFEKVTAK